MMAKDASALRVLRLLVVLGARRWWNIIRTSRKPTEGKRAATKKRGGRLGGFLTVFVGLYMGFNVCMLTGDIHRQVTTVAEAMVPGELVVRPSQLAALENGGVPKVFDARRLPAGVADEWMSRAQEQFEARGAESFTVLERPRWKTLPSAESAPAPWARRPALRVLAVPLTGIVLWVLFLSVGKGLGAGGKEDRSLDWLLTMPVRAEPLLIAKIAEHAVLAVGITFVVTFFLLSIGIGTGYGLWSIPVALLGSAFLAAGVGALRVVLVTWLRLRLKPARLRSAGAFFQMAGLLVILPTSVLVFSLPSIPAELFGTLVHWDWLLWLPTTLPLQMLDQGAAWVPPLLALATPLVVIGAARLGARFLQRGVYGDTGHVGRRGAGELSPPAGLGVARRELLLVTRDKRVLVGRLVVPLVLIVCTAFNFRVGVQGDLGQLGTAKVVAAVFGAGMYSLFMSNMMTLTSEGGGMWLLYSVPVDPARLLLRKTLLWTALISVGTVALGVGVLVVRTRAGAPTGVEDLATWVFGLLGLPLYGLIAGAIGVLGVQVGRLKGADLGHRLRRSPLLAGAILGGGWTVGVILDQAWPRIALLVLFSALALALWRRVSDRMGWLLDPTAKPEPDVDLADSLIVALAFLIIQIAVRATCLLAGMDIGPATFAGFMGAGGTCVLGSLVFFRDRGILEPAQFLRLREGTRFPELVGAVGALPATGVALLWLTLLERSETISHFLGPDSFTLPGEIRWWYAALAVLAAPLFEEFLFRGLVHRGLRRELPVRWAIVAGAALFAVIHPAASSVPVFVLGITTAVVYEKTGSLRAPIAAHAVYNAFVVGAALG